MSNKVQILLRRLTRFKLLKESGAPLALVDVESDLIRKGLQELSTDELLQAFEDFESYQASVKEPS